jgi:NADH-quinone oxidoreductase subunit E
VGRHLVQVCTTTPCWLRGSDDIVAVCKKHIHRDQGAISGDGAFTWIEMECLGACVNAPMVLIDKDPYEDLDTLKFENILSAYRRGEQPKPGPQSERRSSEPAGGRTTLIVTGVSQTPAKT